MLNTIDNFRPSRDSVEESCLRLRDELMELGIREPTIYPISAYFALLLKLRENGEVLDEEEMDDIELLTKKFSKESYDLSKFSPGSAPLNR